MKVVIQRVKKSSVSINNKEISTISNGLLILLGIENLDDQDDINFLCKKTINLRIFEDENGIMNKSVLEIDGDILIVSQFTLHASTKKGNRPSYIKAAKPEFAISMYKKFCSEISNMLGKEVKTGKFGANMQVELINDGPVTIIIDSKNRE